MNALNPLNPLNPLHAPPALRTGSSTRVAGIAALASVAALLAACANPSPPPQLYQLRGQPERLLPGAALNPAPAAASAASSALPLQVQLMAPVTLPEMLERNAILVPRGQAGVQPLAGHLWAEPLRDAVPRLLRQDLSALLAPGQVWAAPLPAGQAVQRQLRVDVLALLANSGQTQVQLQARWTLADPSGRVPARTGIENLSSPVLGSDVDALVAAHRQVLWLLAQQLAQQLARELR